MRWAFDLSLCRTSRRWLRVRGAPGGTRTPDPQVRSRIRPVPEDTGNQELRTLSAHCMVSVRGQTEQSPTTLCIICGIEFRLG